MNEIEKIIFPDKPTTAYEFNDPQALQFYKITTSASTPSYKIKVYGKGSDIKLTTPSQVFNINGVSDSTHKEKVVEVGTRLSPLAYNPVSNNIHLKVYTDGNNIIIYLQSDTSIDITLQHNQRVTIEHKEIENYLFADPTLDVEETLSHMYDYESLISLADSEEYNTLDTRMDNVEVLNQQTSTHLSTETDNRIDADTEIWDKANEAYAHVEDYTYSKQQIDDKIASQGGGATQAYVDSRDVATLNAANAYADSLALGGYTVDAMAGSQADIPGTPTVTTTRSGGSITVVFDHIKGEKGDKGEDGEEGAMGPQGVQGPMGPMGEPGPKGETGPSNTLRIGTVIRGEDASATITGDAPNQTLNLVLPQGNPGPQGPMGPNGPANTLQIGTVAKGTIPQATITGNAPHQILSLVLPQGDVGPQGPKGDTGEVSLAQLNQAMASTLSDAKDYTDGVTENILQQAKDYTDSTVETTLSDAKDYTDSGDANTLQQAKDYTDSKEIDAYTKAETDALLNDKQDTLVSGTNIKTIGGESILGRGDLEISGLPNPEDKDKLLITQENATTSELEWVQIDKEELGAPHWYGTEQELEDEFDDIEEEAHISVLDDYDELTNSSADLTPIGTIITVAGNNVPTGYLKCDYSAISRVDYSKLFNAIGTTYGNGNGSTTFNLPNIVQTQEYNTSYNTGKRDNDGKPIYMYKEKLAFGATGDAKRAYTLTNLNLSTIKVVNYTGMIYDVLRGATSYPYQFKLDGMWDTSTTTPEWQVKSYINNGINSVINFNLGTDIRNFDFCLDLEIYYTNNADTSSTLCYNQLGGEGQISCIKAYKVVSEESYDLIDDATPSNITTYSSSKIESKINNITLTKDEVVGVADFDALYKYILNSCDKTTSGNIMWYGHNYYSYTVSVGEHNKTGILTDGTSTYSICKLNDSDYSYKDISGGKLYYRDYTVGPKISWSAQGNIYYSGSVITFTGDMRNKVVSASVVYWGGNYIWASMDHIASNSDKITINVSSPVNSTSSYCTVRVWFTP